MKKKSDLCNNVVYFKKVENQDVGNYTKYNNRESKILEFVDSLLAVSGIYIQTFTFWLCVLLKLSQE